MPAVIAYFVGFWFRLPPSPRWRFLVAGVMYVGGAVGIEIPEGQHLRPHGEDFAFHLDTALEEGLEMGGVVVFIDALLAHLGRLQTPIVIATHAETSADRDVAPLAETFR